MGIIKLDSSHTKKIKLWTLTSSGTHPSTPRPRLRKVCTACHLNVKQTPILSLSSTKGRQICLSESKTLPTLGRKEQWFFLSSELLTSNKCHFLELIGWLRSWCKGIWFVFSVTSAFSSVPEKVASSMVRTFWHSKLFCLYNLEGPIFQRIHWEVQALSDPSHYGWGCCHLYFFPWSHLKSHTQKKQSPSYTYLLFSKALVPHHP